MIHKNADFRPFFCQKTKKHIWLLGYFGGGSINFLLFKQAAEEFSKAIGAPMDTIHIDEVFKSRRFKGFKFLTSTVDNQLSINESELINDAWKFISD